MPGKSPQEAVDSFLAPLQRALSCISDHVFVHRGGYALETPYAIAVESFKLRCESSLYFDAGLEYQIIKDSRPDYGHYRINTLAYTYILTGEDDKEIFAYQWQPKGKVKTLHLHLAWLGRKFHFPTGRISIEQVIRLLITEFKAKPRQQHKTDWHRILDYTQGRFERFRSWH